jgi:carbonic anhydrase/acetyltransferase-like protein (isoleucine patch superfamily)
MRLDPALTRIDPAAWVAAGATVLGDVWLGADANVWYGSVIRGDIEAIRIGARTNIQDLTVVHADPGFPCTIGAGVTVGHRCVLHGCTIGDGALVGMGAIVMNGAVVGEQSIVGAGALISEGKVFPPKSLIVGFPAQVKRPLHEHELAMLHWSAEHYVEAARAYRSSGR